MKTGRGELDDARETTEAERQGQKTIQLVVIAVAVLLLVWLLAQLW